MSFDLNAGIKALLEFGIAFFIGVCILFWGFTPGHTWVYFLLFPIIGAIIVGKVTGSRQLSLLAFLLIFGWYFWKYETMDNALQWVGRQFPQKVTKRATQGAENYFKGKVPGVDTNKAVQISSRLDQNDVNSCLRGVVTSYSKTEPSLAKNSVMCAGMTGKDFQACMEKNVFDGSVANADMDAARCFGSSESAGPVLSQKDDNLKLGAVGMAICKAKELVNSVPWFNVDASGCP